MRRFVIDGWVYTQCVKRDGKLICKADGGFYKFPLYAKKADEEQKTSPVKEEVSVAS